MMPCQKAWEYRGLISECENGAFDEQKKKKIENFVSLLDARELETLADALMRRMRKHTRKIVQDILAHVTSTQPNPSERLDTVLSIVHKRIASIAAEEKNTPVA